MIRAALISAFSLVAGVAAAHPAMTADATDMRAAPSGRAQVVQSIPPHAQIDVTDCNDRWCAASWRNIEGWVRVEAIAANDAPLEGPPPPGPPPVVFGGPVVVGPVFGYGYYYHRRW